MYFDISRSLDYMSEYSEMKKSYSNITLIIAILCVISIFICDWTIKKNAAPASILKSVIFLQTM
mgnify:CR=1 FL=1